MLLTILQSCLLQKPKTVKIPANFDWEGHRGCRGLRPENTIPAFVHALEIPEVTTLELDIVISKDRQIVVSHEAFFNPDITTKPNGDSLTKAESKKFLFFEMTLAEIQAFDCGRRGNPKFAEQQKMAAFKPTLRQVVEAVKTAHPNRKYGWNIELKSMPDEYGKLTPYPNEMAKLLIDEIRKLGIENASIIQSFDVNQLQEVRKIGTSARLSYLVENAKAFDSNLEKLGFTPDIYSPFHLFITKKLVKHIHEKGVKIVPWTVNDVGRMKQLIAAGVDGIISDYPNLFSQLLK